MVTKSTQTQYGGKFDGQVHKKRPKKGKKQRGYTTERFMPRNYVIMLTLFLAFLKNAKKLGLLDDTKRRKN